MSDFNFNKKDFDKLIAIADSLRIIAKAKGTVSLTYDIDGDYDSITIDEVDNFLEDIFDKTPDSDWEGRY